MDWTDFLSALALVLVIEGMMPFLNPGGTRRTMALIAQLRAEGAETAERIRSEADRDRTVILAEAYRQSEEIRGEGDAEATREFASAHGQNAEFYSFYRSLQAYRRSLGIENDIFVLGPEGEFFRYLKDPAGGRGN
jgi:membrane protease subunit HflC